MDHQSPLINSVLTKQEISLLKGHWPLVTSRECERAKFGVRSLAAAGASGSGIARETKVHFIMCAENSRHGLVAEHQNARPVAAAAEVMPPFTDYSKSATRSKYPNTSKEETRSFSWSHADETEKYPGLQQIMHWSTAESVP